MTYIYTIGFTFRVCDEKTITDIVKTIEEAAKSTECEIVAHYQKTKRLGREC